MSRHRYNDYLMFLSGVGWTSSWWAVSERRWLEALVTLVGALVAIYARWHSEWCDVD